MTGLLTTYAADEYGITVDTESVELNAEEGYKGGTDDGQKAPAPDTGDLSMPMLWAAVMLTAAGAITVVIARRKKNEE